MAQVERGLSDLAAAHSRLAESEARYRTIVETHAELVCCLSPDGVLTYANAACCHYFGCSRDELVGQVFAPSAAAADARRVKQALAALAAGTPLCAVEHAVAHGPGPAHWLQWTFRGGFDDQGGLLTVQVAGRDITRQRHAEQALHGQRSLALALLGSATAEEACAHLLRFACGLPGVDYGAIEAVGDTTTASRPVLSHRTVSGTAEVGPALAVGDSTGGGAASLTLVPVMHGGDAVAVLRLGAADGSSIPATSRQTIEMVAAQAGAALAHLRAEAQLRESRANLRTLVDNLNDMIVVTDEAGRVVEVSAAVTRRTGHSRDELLGMSAAQLCPTNGQDGPAASYHAMPVSPTGTTMRSLTARDGTTVPVEATSVRGRWDGQAAVFYVYRDLSDHERARHAAAESAAHRAMADELQRLSRSRVAAQEDERHRIARELHDEVGQALTGLLLILEPHSRGERQCCTDHARAARAIAADLLDTVRRMSLDLRPARLGELGLCGSLREYCVGYTARTGVRVDLHCVGGERPVPPELCVAAYRIVQEALTNVARHAQTDHASVGAELSTDEVKVTVADDGCGFDGQMQEPAATGLTGMRERARALGGTVQIRSRPGAGTTVTAVFPLTSCEAEQC